ncbi:hypothetical protein F4781DRAFT_443454 [Annulohypoxylon bovei var. microspora]|nr:hypothetical protein F4781DRAFT_443454 [Annulohypoxylon bovei var. microspora]
MPNSNFDDDNEHLTAVTQSAVQDVFWLQGAVNQITQKHQPAYFVPVSGDIGVNPTRFYLIFLHDGIPKEFKAAWRRLARDTRLQARLGSILCSGPTNIAVSEFADRIDSVLTSVCARCNQGKAQYDMNRKRHKLVARAYKVTDEIDAVLALLRKSGGSDSAIQNKRPASLSNWRQKYKESGIDTVDKITGILKALFALVDMLCTTSAMSENVKPYAWWKANVAKGIAVNEAANMHRADLYCLWGNTLLQCFLAGDPNQLSPAPALLAEKGKDTTGSLLNRFAVTGKIPALEPFQASGMPVFRLWVQLRMAKGLFDMVSETIHDAPAKYHECCNIDNGWFKDGRELESYITKTCPSVSASAKDKLSPLFIHCEGTKVSVDKITSSKKSYDQVTVALDFVADLVRTTEVKASRAIILAPYAANVKLIQKLLKPRKYTDSLSGMDQPSTIDGYRGQEKDITIIVMGPRAGFPGPG